MYVHVAVSEHSRAVWCGYERALMCHMLCPTPYRCSGLAHGKGGGRPAVAGIRPGGRGTTAGGDRASGWSPTHRQGGASHQREDGDPVHSGGRSATNSRQSSGQSANMAELLRDNIEADRRRSKEGGASTSSGTEPAGSSGYLELGSVFWYLYFNLCTSTPRKDPAYQTTILREARRCGGNGWQTYDTMFRQQVANNPAADWSKLNSSLYAVNFLADQNGKGNTCQHCLETDHMSSECALAPSKVERSSSREVTRDDSRANKSRWERGERRGRSNRICFSWNDGRCAVPYCEYRHVCTKCSGEHKALHCTKGL